jgi:putative transposase
VRDDKACAEALFRTAKYRTEFPIKGFADLDTGRQWAMRFVQWYNHEHRHSGIRYVTRHSDLPGRMALCSSPGRAVYQDARQRSPQRWSGSTLETGWRRHPESGARYCRPGGNLTNPAFRFDR